MPVEYTPVRISAPKAPMAARARIRGRATRAAAPSAAVERQMTPGQAWAAAGDLIPTVGAVATMLADRHAVISGRRAGEAQPTAYEMRLAFDLLKKEHGDAVPENVWKNLKLQIGIVDKASLAQRMYQRGAAEADVRRMAEIAGEPMPTGPRWTGGSPALAERAAGRSPQYQRARVSAAPVRPAARGRPPEPPRRMATQRMTAYPPAIPRRPKELGPYSDW